MGGGKGIRTPDPLHAMQVLYQLSYTPKGTSMLAVDSRPTKKSGDQYGGELFGMREERAVITVNLNDFVTSIRYQLL